MKKLSFLIAVLLLAGRLHCSSQTVNATYNFADFTGSPQAVKRVQITPIQPIGLVGTNIVFPTTITRQTSTAGVLTVSNLYNGFSYRVILQDANGGSIGQLTNWFGTNVTGNVNASAYTVISTNLLNGSAAYSMAASDARFSKALTPGTNITFITNGASIAINAAGSSTIYATNVTGLGTAAYSNASAFYLASNPSAYVTASITNGLGSAAYSNASAFASSGVTNLTAGQLATLASALTNVAFTNIWVTNGINAGSDSTGTYVRGGDGQPLNLSSGGIAYGYAYGGKGGTVNIAMGGYITNGGSGTSGPGDAGTVNIANGVYTAFLGGQAGLAGTVNIANGASGSGATGSAGTVNIATNNGNTYVGRLSAFGVISGNGSGLTNIASTNITGLGTAAYSNSTAFAPSTVTNLTAGQIATIAAALTNASAFAPSTVTNLTAGQLATIAAAVTNNANPTLTGLSVGAQTALDVNGNGKFGGVGHTNGVLTGNGSGLTNLAITNFYFLPPKADNTSFSFNGGLFGSQLIGYYFPSNTGYSSFQWQVPDYITKGKTNLTYVFLFVTTNSHTVKLRPAYTAYTNSLSGAYNAFSDVNVTLNSGFTFWTNSFALQPDSKVVLTPAMPSTVNNTNPFAVSGGFLWAN